MKTDALNKVLAENILSDESKEKLIALHESISAREFSDLLDAEGNQYVEFAEACGEVHW